MCLRSSIVRDLINHAIQFQVELDKLFVQVGDVVFVSVNRLDVDAVLLPPLLDARISGMATNAFTLSGLEEIDGCLYAKSWWCREA